jgi:hypothetical protein
LKIRLTRKNHTPKESTRSLRAFVILRNQRQEPSPAYDLLSGIFLVLLQFPCEIYASYEAAVAAPTRNSAALRLLKVESGINGLLPTSWVPSIYSVSLLIRLRYALEEVTVFCVRPLCARSSRPAAKRKIKACDFLQPCGKNAAA